MTPIEHQSTHKSYSEETESLEVLISIPVQDLQHQHGHRLQSLGKRKLACKGFYYGCKVLEKVGSGTSKQDTLCAFKETSVRDVQ